MKSEFLVFPVSGKEYKVQIIRSGRKTVSLEIKPDLSLLLRSPYRASDAEIRLLLSEKGKWIEKHIALAEKKTAEIESARRLTKEELTSLKAQAAKVISQRVSYFADIMGVTFGKISIRSQRSRFGSCSREGNLSFNCILMLCPPDVLDYVVVHELCHRKQMNHSRLFWAEVGRVLPDYETQKRWLRENGSVLISRLK